MTREGPARENRAIFENDMTEYHQIMAEDWARIKWYKKLWYSICCLLAPLL